MIITKLQGGLGNQLFQYALGRNLAIKNNTELLFDVSEYKKNPKRCFELENLNIIGRPATEKERLDYCSMWAKFKDLFRARLNKRVVNEKNPFSFDPAIVSSPDDRYLLGYWQNERYFTEIKKELCIEVQPAKPLSEEAQKWLLKIERSKSVSVHVRRGDYVTDAKLTATYETLSTRYYKQGMETIEQFEPEATFFVFSDDIETAKKLLPQHTSIEYVSRAEQHSWEDLYLMSRCRHHIIANSSFSWWGAWLGSYAEQTTVAPRKWFKNNIFDTTGLLPDKWIKI